MRTRTPIAISLSAVALAAFTTPSSGQYPVRTRATLEPRQLQLAAAAPTGIQVAQSGSAVVVSWTPTAEQSAYRVYRGLDQTARTELTPGPLPVTTSPDSSATAGTTYYYTVAAEYADGRVGMAAPVAFTVPIVATRLATLATTDLARRTALAAPGPAPTNVAAVPAPTSIALSWPALLSVSGYRVERSLPAGSPWTTLGSGPALAFADNGLDPDVAVQYRVTAEYADGRVGTSDPISTRTTKPINPSNFRATVAVHEINAQLTPTWNVRTTTSGDVSLSWDPVPGASSYELSGPGLSIPRLLSTTAFGIPDVPPGVAQYSLVAYFTNAVGRRFGDAANPTRLDVTVGAPPVVGFTATSNAGSGPGIVTFNWTDNKGATSFKLLRAEAEAGPYAELTTNLSWAPFYVRDYTSPTRGKTYYYKLVSLFPSGPIAWTPPLAVLVGPEIAIKGLQATPSGGGRVSLSWLPLANVEDFGILRGRGWDPMEWIKDQYGSPMRLSGSASGYQDSGLFAGSTYRYNVCAKLYNGGSACAQVSVAVQ